MTNLMPNYKQGINVKGDHAGRKLPGVIGALTVNASGLVVYKLYEWPRSGSMNENFSAIYFKIWENFHCATQL